jgi:hypothetical protein
MLQAQIDERRKNQQRVVISDVSTEIVGINASLVNIQREGFLNFDPRRYLTVGSDDLQEPYRSRKHEVKTATKWGQLKLLMTELSFLTYYWNPVVDPDASVVYVGAAPGTHTITLAKLFPWLTFHLYDAREFDPVLATLPNVKTYVKLFTPEDALAWSAKKVLFLSDIRSLGYMQGDHLTEAQQRVNEASVMADMNLQMDWVNTIKPLKAYLKFRLPYTWDWIVKEMASVPYFNGTVYLQPWGPQTTTECRLVPDDSLSMIDWDYRKHQDQLFYHNSMTREKSKFVNFIEDNNEPFFPSLGLYNDYDSTLTVYILSQYLDKVNVSPTKDNMFSIANFVLNGADTGLNLISKKAGNKRIPVLGEIAEESDNDE